MTDFLSGSAEIDFDKAASAFPDISLDGSDEFHTPGPSQAPLSSLEGGNSFSFDDFDAAPPTQTYGGVKVTGDDEIEKFEDQFPDIDVGAPAPAPRSTQPTFGATPTFAPRPQPSLFSNTPILNQLPDEDEPQVIKDWREKQAADIQARDEASKAKRQETLAKAERAIDDFYGNYNKTKEKSIRENKDLEADYLANLQSSLSQGTTWERISDFIELQNSQSKTIARTGPGTTDLTRFKEVLLRLKREGDAAPGAAGY